MTAGHSVHARSGIDGGGSPLQHMRSVNRPTRFSAVCMVVLMDPCPWTRLSMKNTTFCISAIRIACVILSRCSMNSIVFSIKLSLQNAIFSSEEHRFPQHCYTVCILVFKRVICDFWLFICAHPFSNISFRKRKTLCVV